MSKEAIEHYEAALKEAFPSGATGDVFHHWNEARKALAEQPAQQEPPTVAELVCVCGAEWEWRNRDWELVTTPPAQRTWVGLTDQEIKNLWNQHESRFDYYSFSCDIEAKLKEKNT